MQARIRAAGAKQGLPVLGVDIAGPGEWEMLKHGRFQQRSQRLPRPPWSAPGVPFSERCLIAALCVAIQAAYMTCMSVFRAWYPHAIATVHVHSQDCCPSMCTVYFVTLPIASISLCCSRTQTITDLVLTH